MREALDRMLVESHWKDRYLAVKLKEDWEALMGKTVARYTTDVQIRDHVLYIRTDVAALKNELRYNRELLIEKLNQHLGEPFIRDIAIM